MTEFADIAAFARQHASCGGITPNATTPVGGGYLLTLACACGATLDRWITAEEASRPLPIAPVAAPSPDVQAARDEALAAEAAAAKPEPVAPSRLTPSPELEAVLREALAAEAVAPAAPVPAAQPPTVEPGVDLEAALRAALAAESAAAPSPIAAARPRPGVQKTDIGATVRDALAAQRALQLPLPPRAGVRGFWIVVGGLSTLALGLALWIGLGGLEIPAPGAPPLPAAPAAAPPPAAGGRTATAEVLQGLRQLQAASAANTGYNVYSSRVLFAKADLERLLKSEASAEAKSQARDIVDLHVLAAAAWRARDLDRKETWETIGQDPAIDLCPTVKRVVDFAESRGEQSRAHARGLALSGAIPLLWECTGARLAKLEESRS